MNGQKFSITARIRSFGHAFRGLWLVISREHNAWIHLGIVALLVPVSIWLKLSLTEWAIIVVCIGLVLSMEIINTAVERLCNQVSPGHDPEIGKIKDILAAAVLVSAIAAAAAGLIILLPKFITAIQG